MVLVAEWGLNEGTGTTAADSSGNGHTLSGSAWEPTAKTGAGIGGPWVASTNGIGPTGTTANYTIMMWTRINTLPASWIGLATSSTANRWFEVHANGSQVRLDWYGGAATTNATISWPVGETHHVAVVVSGTGGTLYVDGVARGTDTAQSAVNLAATDWTFGGGNGDDPLGTNDWIDEIRVFNTALSAAEVTTQMNTSIGGSTPNEGSASGTFSFTGSASGEAPTEGSGSASGTFTFTGSAEGATAPQGSASGAFSFVGSAAGTNAEFVYGKAMSANRRYLVDQLGNPWPMRMTSPWGWVAHYTLSEWDSYFANISAKGFNSTLFELIATGNGGGGIDDTGQNYNGDLPFVGGDITQLNGVYWDHIEAIVDAANAYGVTPILSVIDGWVLDPIFTGKSEADCQAYGNAIATRMNGKHVLWHFGGDYAPVTNEPWNGATTDLQMRAALAGIRAAGHNEVFTVQLNYNYSVSQQNQFWERELGGDSGDGWSFVYTYFATYAGVEEAYNWTTQANQWSGDRNPRPAIFSEANYWQENVGGGAEASEATTAETIRRQVGWAVTFGSPGFGYGDDNWDGTQASYSTYLDDAPPTQVNDLADRVFGKAGWQNLAPDTALITSGAGTKRTGEFAEDVLENDYATAARTPDGTLAVVYVPTSRSITLDLGLLGANPVATWYNPVTGATSSAGAGPTYTTPGAHADGANDYLLEITADSSVPQGSSSAAFSFSATASGSRTSAGSSSANFAFSASASGGRASNGLASSAFSFSGAASGARSPVGAANAAFGFTGTASGSSPTEGAHSGSGAGFFTFTATASGARSSLGSSSGLFTFTAAASGLSDARARVIRRALFASALRNQLSPTPLNRSLTPASGRRTLTPVED